MDKESRSNAQERHSRPARVPTHTYISRDKHQDLTRLLTCPLCNNICREATTINECNHTFCKECIYRKVQSETEPHCPKCDIDLSALTPEDYLRSDEMLRRMIEVLGKPLGSKRPEASLVAQSSTASATFEPPNQDVASEAAGKCKTELKKKRSNKRIRHQFPSCQNEDDGKEEVEDELEKKIENNSAGLYESVTSKEENIEGLSESEFFNEHEMKCASVWFRLLPQEDETGHVYLRLAKSYIYVKDGDDKASKINELLMKRLNLESEDEVEVCCFGKPITEGLTFSNVFDSWINCTIARTPLESENMDIMRLTYKRRMMPKSPNDATMA